MCIFHVCLVKFHDFPYKCPVDVAVPQVENGICRLTIG